MTSVGIEKARIGRPKAARRLGTTVAFVVALGVAATALPSAPVLARGPDSLADLADQVSDAVVNISATQSSEEKRTASNPPQLQPGTPFDELFEEFFKRRQQQGGDGPRMRERHANSLGSGFVIDPSGIVVTNNHVIADANDVTVILTSGEKLKAEIVGKDTMIDVAVLRVKPDKPLKAVKFGDSERMRVGDWVMAVGNPYGLGGTVTAGIISARNRNIDSGPYDNFIQTDAAINKGNSGGPLFNMAGEVIGINTAIYSPSGGSIGIGFATPAAMVAPIIDQLRKYGETRRGWLGVRIQNVDDTIADSLSLGSVRGALVAGTDDRGPAKAAGIQTGDVIVKFDGVAVKDSHDLSKIVAAAPVGKDVEVIVVRQGKEQAKTVKLGRLEDNEKQASLTNKEAEKPAPNVVQKALGMSFSQLSSEVRQKYSIADSVTSGVVVTDVESDSAAADKHIAPGEVIVEINQDPVKTPAEIAAKVDALKDAGKKSALLLVANAQGEVRFVALALP
jgi:serine protease Do